MGKRHPAPIGIPALVFVKTGETIIINGKTYNVLHMMYDLKGKHKPLAMPIGRM